MHRMVDQINVARHANLGIHIACSGHGAHAGEPRQCLLCMRQGIPTILAETNDTVVNPRGALPIGQINSHKSLHVFDRGPNTVTPSAFVAATGSGKSAA